MKEPLDENRIRELLQRLPRPSIPVDLVAAIEAETLFKRHWWESDVFQVKWLPIFVGLATAVGALWLSKVQVGAHRQPVIPMVAVPFSSQEPIVSHAFLPKTESLDNEKGESREN